MRSLDELKRNQAEKLETLQQAMKENDNEKATAAMAGYLESMQEGLRAEMEMNATARDEQILSARGIRQLTQEEKAYYTAFAEAASSMNPKQALANLDKAMPKTVINAVFEDLVKDHPLLDAIDFVNTTGLTEFIVNRGSKQLATWGKICSEIKTELAGDIDVVQLGMNKLSAFVPVCKSMLIIGPEWLDRYVRAMLYDALAYGLEEGIINGTGVDQPIGMIRDIEAAHSDGQPYAEKKAVALADFGVAALGEQLAKLALDRNKRPRKVGELLLIYNPLDYYTKIAPATRMLTTGGAWVDNLPYPVRLIESEQVPQNKVILGRAGGYFMGLGLPKDGRIEYSDDYHFLEDERVYLIKLLGGGFPKDNSSYVVLDISKTKPVIPSIKTEAAAPATGA